jgi:hypothetical protein
MHYISAVADNSRNPPALRRATLNARKRSCARRRRSYTYALLNALPDATLCRRSGGSHQSQNRSARAPKYPNIVLTHSECTPICTLDLILLLPIALPDDALYQHSDG